MNWKFWKRKESGEPEIKNVRQIEDIKISVITGLSGTRTVSVSGWNEPMTEGLFWKIWDGIREREDE